MLYNIELKNVLFLDIETVPLYPDYKSLPDKTKDFWDKKANYLIKNEDETPESIYNRAGIYSEFGKIICISTGILYSENGQYKIKTKSFYSDDENKLLNEFADLLNKHFNKDKHLLCAHNGKEFDFPYIARRMLINGIRLPEILNSSGKKPWEIKHLDTMEMWRFGDYKSYTSLDLLTHIFNIPSPKNDIKGSDVYKVYYQEKDLPRIVNYCEKDVIAIIQLLLKYTNNEIIPAERIIKS